MSSVYSLQFASKFDTNYQTYMSWYVHLFKDENVDIRIPTYKYGVLPGLQFSFQLNRQPDFMSKIFVYPTIIFVILAYTSFFIDKNGAPARVTVVITNIFNTVSLLVSTMDYIPLVSYPTWLRNFLMWNLYFTVIPIVQYAILNSSINYYASNKKEIADMIAEMMALSIKFNLGDEPGELLQESRKKIQKQVRATITGGDVLQIEDF